MSNEIIVTEEQLKLKVSAVLKAAQELNVIDDASNQIAGNMVNELGGVLKQAKAILEPREKAKKAATEALANLKSLIYTPTEQAREIVRRKMSDYATAETLRRRKIEEAARLEQEKLIKKAEAKAVKQGVPIAPMPFKPIIATAPVQAAGVSLVESYSAEVVDLMALVKAVAAGKADISYLEANMPTLNAKAKATAKDGEMLPGVMCRMKMIPRGRMS